MTIASTTATSTTTTSATATSTAAAAAAVLPPRDDAVLAAHHQLRTSAEALRWTLALTEAEIPHVILKGVGFDAWLGRTRPTRDIDVLIPRRSERALARLLRAEGYHRILTEPLSSTWAPPPGRLPMDVHLSIKGCGAAPEVVWRALGRPATIDVGGVAVPVLSSPGRELVAGLHVVLSPGDERPLADLAAALDRSTPADWAAARSLARALGCGRLLDVGLSSLPAGRALLADAGAAPVVLGGGAGTEASTLGLSLLLALVQQQPTERWRQIGRFLRIHPVALARTRPIGAGSASASVAVVATRRAMSQLGALRDAVRQARRLHHDLIGHDLIGPDLTEETP